MQAGGGSDAFLFLLQTQGKECRGKVQCNLLVDSCGIAGMVLLSHW